MNDDARTAMTAMTAKRQALYAKGLAALSASGVPFLVGGGFALWAYLGPCRPTKDLDVFVRKQDVDAALAALAAAGFTVERTDPAWLGKATAPIEGAPPGEPPALIDVIFCSYNGLFPVDDAWLANGRAAEVLGIPVRVVGPEEMLVSKCFVAARDRFDGGDISSVIRALGPQMNWGRVETLMRDHFEVLLLQLVHFFYVFPTEAQVVPRDLVARLLARLRRSLAARHAPVEDRGDLLDPKRYREQPPLPEDAAAIASLCDECAGLPGVSRA
jgi:hypothetical protein